MLEDKDGIQKFFEEVAGSSCQALFSDYGVNLQRLDPVAATGDDISFLMCGVIGKGPGELDPAAV